MSLERKKELALEHWQFASNARSTISPQKKLLLHYLDLPSLAYQLEKLDPKYRRGKQLINAIKTML